MTLFSALTGSGLFARALRGSAFTGGAYALAQMLRLASNLILTRLLYPEAFGVMALVSVVLVGLALFSDLGIGPAISQSARGDDRDFLNTAWTINVARGVILWLLSILLAWPAAQFYAVPELMAYLPVAGLTLLIAGFNPTRIDTANRHLLLGRVTALDLMSQMLGILVMVLLSWVLQSVWGLILGAIFGALAKLALTMAFLPGEKNRLRWEAAAGRQLIHFGKWIFLSTTCTFVLSQGDKAILGAYLSLEELGIYNIGFFLASFPILLGGAVTGRIMIPLYRDRHPAASPENARALRQLRFGLTGGLLFLLGIMAFAGVPLVHFLYDDRYLGADPVLVAVACVQMLMVVTLTYDHAALAAGDARTYFFMMALRAGAQTAAFLFGVHHAGVAGALLGQGAASLATYPVVVLLARRYRAWDGLHDAIFGAAVIVMIVIVLEWNAASLATLWP